MLGFSVVFVALGASFSAAGQFLLDYRDWIRRIGGALIVLFGLYIAGLLKIGLFGRTQQWQIREKPAGYLGSFLVGRHVRDRLDAVRGPDPRRDPLAGRDRRDGRSGASACSSRTRPASACRSCSRRSRSASFLRFFKRYRPFIPIVERGAGVLLIVVGVLVFTNYYVVLNAWAISLTPGVAAQAALSGSLLRPRPRSRHLGQPRARASTRSAWRWRSTTRSRRGEADTRDA